MTYDYDNAPTDPTHGGKMTAEQAAEEIRRLRGALEKIQRLSIILLKDDKHDDLCALQLFENCVHNIVGMTLCTTA